MANTASPFINAFLATRKGFADDTDPLLGLKKQLYEARIQKALRGEPEDPLLELKKELYKAKIEKALRGPAEDPLFEFKKEWWKSRAEKNRAEPPEDPMLDLKRQLYMKRIEKTGREDPLLEEKRRLYEAKINKALKEKDVDRVDIMDDILALEELKGDRDKDDPISKMLGVTKKGLESDFFESLGPFTSPHDALDLLRGGPQPATPQPSNQPFWMKY